MFDHLRQGPWLMQVEGPLGETVGEAVVHVLNDALSEVTIEVAAAFAPASDQPGPSDVDWPPRGRPPSMSDTTTFVGSIRGRVVGAGGSPIGDATLTVVAGAGQFADIAPVTDQDGWFALDNLPVGRWRLRAMEPGGATGEAAVEVFENALSEMTIEIPDVGSNDGPAGGRPAERPHELAGSLRGNVIRADNHEPVGRVTVMIVGGPAAAPDVAPVTDRDGWFAFDDLAPGDWHLRADGPNGETGDATAHVEGGALSEVTILVARGDADEVLATRTPPPRTANKRRRVVTSRVRGRVVRADTGEPVADAAITASGSGAAPDIAPLSNEEGLFFFDGLAPGQWQLSALGPRGEAGQTGVKLEAGAIANIVIRVEARGRPRRR
ncbi:MAG: carboxypeptidase regulatory-like domain-containing protein [Planctomycetia bacterium]|nr:carboxypeptidase regulatory-like domain-containing protein [Planctomycetia bacterium]